MGMWRVRKDQWPALFGWSMFQNMTSTEYDGITDEQEYTEFVPDSRKHTDS